jgi:hypothetical protein
VTAVDDDGSDAVSIADAYGKSGDSFSISMLFTHSPTMVVLCLQKIYLNRYSMSRFRNLFFVDEKNQEKEQLEPVVKPPTKTITETVSPVVSAQTNTEVSSVPGKVSEQILEQLCLLMDSLNTGRADYLQYKKSVDALKEYQPDESARFLTAFITLKPLNPDLTKGGLLDSVDQYIKLITNEKGQGLQELDNIRKDEIGSLEKSLEHQAKELVTLEAKIADLKKSISDKSAQVLAKRSEFQIKENDFNATVTVILNQLQSDRNKISQILK